MMRREHMPSLRKSFQILRSEIGASLAREASPLRLGLAMLAIASERFNTDYLSIDEVVTCLEASGIAVKPEAIRNAFARAGDRLSRREFNHVVKYRIMTAGLDEVRELTRGGNVQIIYVEGDLPRTDRRRLGDILSRLAWEIRVSDPYYGASSLDLLETIPQDRTIRFLTSRTSEDGDKLRRLIGDFRRERPHAELRLYPYPNPSELHDRYVLSADQLLLVGHVLKDVGRKESFIMAVSNALAPDLLDAVRGVFDERWTKGPSL
ncbi:MAG: hypothetical protein ACT4P5_20770 [Armatimonadota bacterium]